MIIEIGTKWVKDGEVVEVTYIVETVGRDEVIYYKCKQGKEHISYDYDFLEQYKPYESVYEWQWCYITNLLPSWHTTGYMTQEEFIAWQCSAHSSLEYKLLHFTKRERKL